MFLFYWRCPQNVLTVSISYQQWNPGCKQRQYGSDSIDCSLTPLLVQNEKRHQRFQVFASEIFSASVGNLWIMQ